MGVAVSSSSKVSESDLDRRVGAVSTAVKNLATVYYVLVHSLQEYSVREAKNADIQDMQFIGETQLPETKMVRVFTPRRRRFSDLVVDPTTFNAKHLSVVRVPASSEPYYLYLMNFEGSNERLLLSVPPRTIVDAVHMVANIDALDKTRSKMAHPDLGNILDTFITIAKRVSTLRLERPDPADQSYVVEDSLPVLEIVLSGDSIKSVDVWVWCTNNAYSRCAAYYYTIDFNIELFGRSYRYRIPYPSDTYKYAGLLVLALSYVQKEKDIEAFNRLSEELLNLTMASDALLKAWTKYNEE